MTYKTLYISKINIYIMIREKTKKNFTVSMNRKIFNIVDEKFTNKSKYIEWLIYQDLLKNDLDNIEKLKKLLI